MTEKNSKKPRLVRLLSLLLTAVMLVTAQGFTTLADTVSQNDVKNLSVEEEADSGQAVTPEGVAAPANPVHRCEKDDFTEWSYIYFGSYPQSEVTDQTIIAAIDSAIEAEETAADEDVIEAEDADAFETVGKDVELEGIKYRRISKDDCNNTDYFDDVENNGYRYFKWEPIKWRVLDNNDNGTLFVMAASALDCKCYNDEYMDITWEDSTIRSWLNGSFYQTAFNSAEQSTIEPWNVVNKNNPDWETEGGNGKTDNVYLLSIGEVTNERYGFCSEYSAKVASRRLQTSEYAHTRGAYSCYEGSWWWLRSFGGDSYYAANVTYYGNVDGYGDFVSYDYDGVVPALHIKLSSALWSVVENDSSGEGDIPENPVHHCVKDNTDWSYIYFGSYPQSEVTDSDIIAAIDSAIAAGNTEAGADRGVDVWVNGTKYRRISRDDCNNDFSFDSIKNNGYRYFKWERIKWRVVDNNDDGTLFVMADNALDCKGYHDDGGKITWENSTIRSWLNGSFYQMSFNSSEQSAIASWHVVNEDDSEWVIEGGNDTKDYVYLLSIGEVTNESYGFCSDYYTVSVSRRLQTSDYANARGAWRDTSTSSVYEGNCRWWLRSPSHYGDDAAIVDYDGYVHRGGNYVFPYYDGVAPALHINLSSNLWLLTDDGTSGEGGGASTGGNQNQNPSNPDPQPAPPQPIGTTLTASQVTSRTDTVPQGASFTVTDSNPANPTVSFDGVSNENAAAVSIPKTITYKSVEYKVTTVSPTAFSTKKDNASFTVTDNRVESLTAEYKAMSNAKKTKVTVPESVTYKGIKFKVTSVAAKSFKNNKKVKQVSIADSVTKIGDSAFEGCTSLKSVTLGKGTSTIGKNAFKNCKKLTKITIKSTKLKTVGKNALKGVNAKCKIKVPAKQLKKYQNLFKKKGQKNSVKLVK